MSLILSFIFIDTFIKTNFPRNQISDIETYDGLPVELKYSTERQIEKKKILADVLIKLKLHKYTTVFQSFDSFEDFKTMSEVVPSSETSNAIKESDRWRTDEEFGREFLAGVNPVMIRRCKEPIQKFPVTNGMVGGLLDREKTLEEEMKVDYSNTSII
jgi:hypothetical protein